MFRSRFRALLALLAVATVLTVIVSDADARARISAGSRGTRTFSAPPTTTTAPTARPIERSMTTPGQPGGAVAQAPRPATQPGGFFSRPGLLGGLAAGFLGAGLIGMLLGHGFLGGLGGLASFLGLILQVGLVAMVGYLLWSWWQRRSQPQPAYAGGANLRDIMQGERPRTGLGGLGAGPGGYGGGTSAPAARSDEIGTTPADFDAFERLLGDIQTAYGNEDVAALRSRVTPEMLSYFAEELAANASRGVVNRISDVKLLQGDAAEAWREGDTEYATVAMRYALNDQMVDRASGRVVEGGPDEATEVWTFRRVHGGPWMLSAIQQA
jgi:predicted lipid-binding transport protein (Tim44 family)